MKTVTAILTIYKRVDYLERQITSLLNQSYKIDQFIINVNVTDRKEEYMEIINRLIPEALVVEHSFNLGVWSRFFLGFNCNTDFIFVIDDDIIPGSEYIQNCVECFEKEPGIYGSWGSLFKSLQIRRDRYIFSESDNIPIAINNVDISGHSWFFSRNDLPKMFDKLPENLEKYKVCGEELRVSYRGAVNGVKTFVPPMDNKEKSGNVDPRLGIDKVAGYNLYGNTLYQEFYAYTIKDGFKPLLFK
ncbi:MAG: glycosyltransferase family A protein [Candidatus Gracilibacteria bacterium]|nr:glycosyltransferase family A protein [Candidatus Gracilibacteria bacterium]